MMEKFKHIEGLRAAIHAKGMSNQLSSELI